MEMLEAIGKVILLGMGVGVIVVSILISILYYKLRDF